MRFSVAYPPASEAIHGTATGEDTEEEADDRPRGPMAPGGWPA